MEHIEILMQRYPELEVCRDSIVQAVQGLILSYKSGGKLLVCGNGGSSADCAHIVGELMKAFVLPRRLTEAQRETLRVAGDMDESMGGLLQQGLPAVDLTAQAGLNTAFLNDAEPALCFAQQAFAYSKQGDVLLGLSTSGNSENAVKAGIAAKSKGAFTIGLTGERHCRMDEVFDLVIHVPAKETYRIQEYHLSVYHAICLAVEQEFFGKGLG